MKMKLFVAIVTVFSGCMVFADDAKPENLEGIWLPESAEFAGKPFPDELRKSIKLEIKGDAYIVTAGPQTDKGTCKLNPAAKPKTIDITGGEGPNKGKTILAIYERKGDVLKVCYDLGGKDRPKEFKTTEGTTLFLVEYKLKK